MEKNIFIIAEAGVNHNGDLELARRLIRAAAEAGADAVKFQSFRADSLATKTAAKAAYQQATTDKSESQYQMLRKLELSVEDHKILIEECRNNGIEFMSSPFDISGIHQLVDLGLETIKVPSGEIINLPYLKELGGVGKRIILSTGMSNLGEIEDALEVLIKAGTPKDDITVLHCNTEYPTPMEDVNLRAMDTIARAFQVRVGYSDHTLGIEVPIAAAALGAEVIEKHFTLDRTMEGPDHKASLEPGELKKMVRSIRNIEKALGSGIKKPSPSEARNLEIARKYVVAAIPITKGEILTETNLAVKRCGEKGISPMRWSELLGRQAAKTFDVDEPIIY